MPLLSPEEARKQKIARLRWNHYKEKYGHKWRKENRVYLTEEERAKYTPLQQHNLREWRKLGVWSPDIRQL